MTKFKNMSLKDMKPKDRVVQATDRIAEALTAMVRIDYGNTVQMEDNTTAVRRLLLDAVLILDGVYIDRLPK